MTPYTEVAPGVYVRDEVEEVLANAEAFQRTLAEIQALPERT